MGLINLIKLGVISLGTINTIAGGSPSSTGGSITLVSRTFILVRKLIQIDVTFRINGLGVRIIHISVNNHLVHALKLFVLLVHNRAGT